MLYTFLYMLIGKLMTHEQLMNDEFNS